MSFNVSHEEPWRAWRSALASKRMHHAWLLSGKSGLGKGAFALAAARELVGASAEIDQHPDVLHLTHPPKDKKEADKKAAGKSFEVARNIKVDQVRAMQQRLTTRPTLGERRAIIIDPSDDMERGASNALLKSLEEPPIGTFFLLVCHSPAKLLPTIRSRCRVLRFASLGSQQMAELLNNAAPDIDPALRDAAIDAGGGSPGSALSFIEHDLGRISGILRSILDNGDNSFALRGELSGAIGNRPSREKLAAILDLARGIVAGGLENAPQTAVPARIETHAELVRLTGEMPTYNYDPGLFVMEIGTLLVKASRASAPRDV